MPTQDELQAAKRLAAFIACQSIYTEDEEAVDQVDKDTWILARAYLAEHPADDDEPVTPSWFISLGAIKNGPTVLELFNGENRISFLTTTGQLFVNGRGIGGRFVRRRVRQLLAALGIVLKESP